MCQRKFRDHPNHLPCRVGVALRFGELPPCLLQDGRSENAGVERVELLRDEAGDESRECIACAPFRESGIAPFHHRGRS